MSKIIAVSDLHLRHSTDIPRWRGETTEEWYAHQYNRLMTIKNALIHKGEGLFIAGDIFHRVDPGHATIGMFNKVFGTHTHYIGIMPGNHDVRYGQTSDMESGYESIRHVYHSFDHFGGCGWVPYGVDTIIGENHIVGVHTLLFEKQSDVPYGVSKYETAETLVAKYPDTKVLIVGDMHRPFSTKINGTLVVNCGSMTVQSINEAEYDHGYWIIDTDALTAEFVKFTDPCIILDEKQQLKKADDKDKDERRERISQMVGLIKQNHGGKHGIDFESILDDTLTKENVSDTIQSKIRTWR